MNKWVRFKEQFKRAYGKVYEKSRSELSNTAYYINNY
jgi:hypothetical protein